MIDKAGKTADNNIINYSHPTVKKGNFIPPACRINTTAIRLISFNCFNKYKSSHSEAYQSLTVAAYFKTFILQIYSF